MGKKAKKTGQSVEKALPGDIRQRFVYILLFYATPRGATLPLGLKFLRVKTENRPLSPDNQGRLLSLCFIISNSKIKLSQLPENV